MEDVNIETFYDFLKNLNEDNTDTDDTADPISQTLTLIMVLTRNYRQMKLTKKIQLLKNNKTSGLDNITNEYI